MAPEGQQCHDVKPRRSQLRILLGVAEKMKEPEEARKMLVIGINLERLPETEFLAEYRFRNRAIKSMEVVVVEEKNEKDEQNAWGNVPKPSSVSFREIQESQKNGSENFVIPTPAPQNSATQEPLPDAISVISKNLDDEFCAVLPLSHDSNALQIFMEYSIMMDGELMTVQGIYNGAPVPKTPKSIFEFMDLDKIEPFVPRAKKAMKTKKSKKSKKMPIFEEKIVVPFVPFVMVETDFPFLGRLI